MILSISVEPGSIANGSVLEIISQKKGLIFEPISSGEAVINSSMDKQDNSRTAPYSVQVPAVQDQEENVTDITVAMVTLPAVGPYAKIDFKLIFNTSLEKQSVQEEVTEYLVMWPIYWVDKSLAYEDHLTKTKLNLSLRTHRRKYFAKQSSAWILVRNVHLI